MLNAETFYTFIGNQLKAIRGEMSDHNRVRAEGKKQHFLVLKAADSRARIEFSS